jgi:hypothetical protein
MRRKPHHLRRRRAGFGEWVQLVGAFDVPLGCAGRWECVMEQGRRSGGCVVGTCDLAFDALEPRRLLVGFAGIGFDRVSSTLDAYIIEGTTTPSGLASGQVFVSGASGRSTGTPLAREWVEQRDLGSLFLRPSLGAEGRDIELGANFWSSRGYPAGWHAGVDSAPGTGQLSYMIERPATATVAALEGNWIWTVFQWNPSTGAATVLNGTLSVSGNFMLWFATGIGAAPVARTTEITSVGSAGLFETNRGESVYISADGSVMLTADMRESDGDVFIGVALKADSTVTVAEVAGGYRFGVAAASVAAQQLFGTGTTGIGAQYLDLRGDGTATVYGLADYDAGDTSHGNAATWTLSGSTLRLRLTGTPAQVEFAVSQNGSTLTPFAMISQQGRGQPRGGNRDSGNTGDRRHGRDPRQRCHPSGWHGEAAGLHPEDRRRMATGRSDRGGRGEATPKLSRGRGSSATPIPRTESCTSRRRPAMACTCTRELHPACGPSGT